MHHQNSKKTFHHIYLLSFGKWGGGLNSVARDIMELPLQAELSFQ